MNIWCSFVLLLLVVPAQSACKHNCQNCDYDKITPRPTEAGSELPSGAITVIVDGCYQTNLTCYRTEQTFCRSVSMMAELTTGQGEQQIGSGDSNKAEVTINCNKNEKWVYEGIPIKRLYCLFSGCI